MKITDEAVEAAVKLSERYINDRYLPDKAIDLIDEASSRKQLAGYQVPRNLEELQKKTEELAEEKEAAVLAGDFEKAAALRDEQAAAQKKFLDMQQRLQKKMENYQPEVKEGDIAAVVSAWTKIPVQRLEEKEAKRLLRLESVLHKRVVGQDEAVSAVARAIKRGRVGLKDPKTSYWFLPVFGPHRCRKNGTFQGTGRGSLSAASRL